MNYVKKKELIQLLDRGNEIDQLVFDSVDGEEYAFSDEVIQIEGLREPFEQLIPKTTWTKIDFPLSYSQLSLLGTQQDNEGKAQLLIGVDDVEHSFITTTEAVYQLFEPVRRKFPSR
ncbi:hypothetical protein HFN20_09615 [Paenibacillus dendritiformis]|uniref:hypothetical protein n=1 Tax=Paenibacillus dendritiformis TaxID=130049 RepID=UPI00143D0D93|nr:hypothetical protein [Paenibacillus dendritiformis]NKI21471.1 hypothetical protein [Paenibacillus dendritiformis]NRF97167.1 hypothetical protein [Paenibacillus dendritiformis]